MENSAFDRIETAREGRNVLEHPFYQRWSAGELTQAELADYSGQYRHAVEAIAEVSAYVAEQLPEHPELAAHAREEADHVTLWDGFVEAVGGDAGADPNAETSVCSDTWARRDGVLAALGRLYAIESGQPEISKTKLEGLSAHYDVPAGTGTHYFSVHRGRDVEHAAEGRALIEELLAAGGSEDEVVRGAEEAFAANWKLLDGVS